uniref:Uncharacterized protein n=1 Tax=viral metagenome TaxID=1070528 RepID=A0A6C0KDE5_9ZZZZ
MYKINDHGESLGRVFIVRDINNDEIKLETDTGDTILDLKKWIARKVRGAHIELKASGGHIFIQDSASDIPRFSLYTGNEELKDDQVIDSIDTNVQPLVINMVDNYSSLVLSLQNMAGDQIIIRGEDLTPGNIKNPNDVKLHISRNNILGVNSPVKYIVLIDNDTLDPVKDNIDTAHTHTIFANDNTDKMLSSILVNLLRDSELLVRHLEETETPMENIDHFYGYLDEMKKLKEIDTSNKVLDNMIKTCSAIISYASESGGDEIMLADTLKRYNYVIRKTIDKLN